MAENEFHPTLFNPFMLWTDMAMKTTEMMVSTGQVLGERIDELARAGANPSPRDMKQLSLGTPDKVKAATDTGLEMATSLQNAGFQLMARAWQQWFSSWAALTALTSSKTFGEALARQDRLFKSLTRSSAAAPQRRESEATDVAPKAGRGGKTAHARRQTRVSRTGVAASKR